MSESIQAVSAGSLDVAWAERNSILDRPKDPDGPARLYNACLQTTRLTKRYPRNIVEQHRDKIERLGKHLREGEAILHVAFAMGGSSNRAFAVVVLTSARLGVGVMGWSYSWHLLCDVIYLNHRPGLGGGSSTTYAVRNKHGELDHLKLVHAEPRSSLIDMSWTVQQPDARIVARTAARYLGGDVTWKQDGPAPGDRVEVLFTQSGRSLVTSKGLVVADWDTSDPGITIDSQDAVGRSLRKGRLATTAAASLLISPLAMVGVLASTDKGTKVHMLMTVATDRDYALFSLLDSGAALKMKGKVRGLEARADTRPEVAADLPASSKLEQLERLASLRLTGALSTEEFESLKAELLAVAR